MTPTLIQTEGIVLRITKYGEGNQIASLFTSDRGLIKLVIKGGSSIRRQQASPLSPLTRVEVSYKSGSGELHTCREANPIERFQREDQSYAQLEAACLLAKAIDMSQLLEKPSPKLYALLTIYLRELQKSPYGEAWICSFYLKILKHDGLLDSLMHCTTCGCQLDSACISNGESYCTAHRVLGAISFSSDELHAMHRLLEARSTQIVGEMRIAKILVEKIRTLFEQCLN